MKRRNMLKGLTLIPLAASALPGQSMFAAPLKDMGAASDPLKVGPDIFRSIGVEPIINCRGTFTIIGGSLERPEVRAAMDAASHKFIQYDELAHGIGDRLGEIMKTEWGMVSAGCAAGLKHVTAACVTGGNPEKLIRIPDLSGLEKTEVIIPRYSRNVYDHAIRNIGVKIIEVETPEELEQALNPRTAMIYLTTGRSSDTGAPLSLETIVKLAKPANVPVLIDAAAEDLTIPSVHLQRGATIVAYSGGKAICGPQCSGLLLGDKNILLSAWQASSPHHGPGRDNKVGREEMIGLLAAVETWANRDAEGEWKKWLDLLDTIAKKVAAIDGVTTEVEEPTDLSNRSPVLIISWDPNKLNVTGDEIAEEVGRSKPRIALGSGGNDEITSINITSGQMQPGEDKIVAERLYEVLSQKRSPKPTTMAAPIGDINGKWDVDVTFFSSQSRHVFSIQQDGNWISGTHKGDYATRDMVGTIEGNEIKLRSNYRASGDNITFIFSGSVAGDTMSGEIHLGEYQTAKFSAKKSPYRNEHKQIMVPGGPPLAT